MKDCINLQLQMYKVKWLITSKVLLFIRNDVRQEQMVVKQALFPLRLLFFQSIIVNNFQTWQSAVAELLAPQLPNYPCDLGLVMDFFHTE